MGLQWMAGGAIGLLLGLLVGLSSSPVVATVVGAVVSGLLVILGLAPKGTAGGEESGQASAARLCGFGLVCAVALIVGVYLRTHNALSSPFSNQVSELVKAGFTQDEAHAWVAYTNAGMIIRSQTFAPGPAKSNAAGTASSYLFASGGADTCALFKSDRYKDQNEQLNALKLAGGSFGRFADALEPLDAKQRSIILETDKLLYCP